MTGAFVVLCFISAPFYAVMNGWFIATLWRWFIVPTFPAPALSIPVAIGIAMLFETIHPRWTGGEADNEVKRKTKSVNEILLTALLTPVFRVAIGLACAYVVKGFM